MIPSVRESSRTSALIVCGGYYISFYLPFDKKLRRHMCRADVRRRDTKPGESVIMPPRAYRFARCLAFSAILRHRSALQIPAPLKTKWTRPVQLHLQYR